MKSESDALGLSGNDAPATAAAPKKVGQLLNELEDKKKDVIQKQAIVEMAGFQAL